MKERFRGTINEVLQRNKTKLQAVCPISASKSAAHVDIHNRVLLVINMHHLLPFIISTTTSFLLH